VIESSGQKHALQIGESFNPFLEKLFKTKQITLRGTLFEKDCEPLALLNKKLISIGEDIRGVRVLEIDNHSIVIESGGMKRRLQMGESFDPSEE
jgi:ABC-type enterochelin transport system substrate-binding protein